MPLLGAEMCPHQGVESRTVARVGSPRQVGRASEASRSDTRALRWQNEAASGLGRSTPGRANGTSLAWVLPLVLDRCALAKLALQVNWEIVLLMGAEQRAPRLRKASLPGPHSNLA